MEEGYTTLTSSRGIPELREAVARSLKERYGVTADPAREIVAVPGAKFGIFAALAAILEEGDEVICPSPFFPPHREAVEMLGGRFIGIPLMRGDNGPRLERVELERRLSPRSKVLLMNFPHNPTGWVPGEEELNEVVRFVAEHGLFVISDEVYERITFDGIKHRTILSFDAIRDRAIMVNSFSKSYAMTGFRLGYCVADQDIAGGIVKVQQNTTTCPAAMVQRAGVQALNGPQDFPDMLARCYEARRDLILERLSNLPRVRPLRPAGALFVFIDIKGLGVPSEDVALRLLEEEGVALSPGAAFGEEWDGFLRISMTEEDEKIDAALGRICSMLRKLA